MNQMHEGDKELTRLYNRTNVRQNRVQILVVKLFYLKIVAWDSSLLIVSLSS